MLTSVLTLASVSSCFPQVGRSLQKLSTESSRSPPIEQFIDAFVHDGLFQHFYFEEFSKESCKPEWLVGSLGFHGLHLPLQALALVFLKQQNVDRKRQLKADRVVRRAPQMKKVTVRRTFWAVLSSFCLFMRAASSFQSSKNSCWQWRSSSLTKFNNVSLLSEAMFIWGGNH